MPEEPTKTEAAEADAKATPTASEAAGKSDVIADIAADVAGDAAASPKGGNTSDGDEKGNWDPEAFAKKMEETFRRQGDAILSKVDAKLKDLGTATESFDEGDEPSQPNPSSDALDALAQKLADVEARLSGQQQSQKVVGALRKAQEPTPDGAPGLTEDQIKTAWEFLDTEQAQMAGFSKRNFESDAGIRALAFAAGALKVAPSGPLGQDTRDVIGAEDMTIDYKSGKIVKPKLPGELDDISHLPIAERVKLRTIERLAKQATGE